MKGTFLIWTICLLTLTFNACKPDQEEIYPELKVDMSLAGKATDSSYLQLYLNGTELNAFKQFSTMKLGSDPSFTNYCSSVFTGSYTRNDTIFEWSISFISDALDSMFMYLYALQRQQPYSLRTMEGNREIKSRGVEISYRARKPDSAKIYFQYSSADTVQQERDSYFSLDGFSSNSLIPQLTNVCGRFKCRLKKSYILQGDFQGKFAL